MAARPFIQLFKADFLRDTAHLSSGATGAWIRLLCHLDDSNTPGLLTGKPSLFARLLHETAEQAARLLEEIRAAGLAFISLEQDEWSVLNRRIVRDYVAREKERIRSGRRQKKNEDALMEDEQELADNLVRIAESISGDNSSQRKFLRWLRSVADFGDHREVTGEKPGNNREITGEKPSPSITIDHIEDIDTACADKNGRDSGIPPCTKQQALGFAGTAGIPPDAAEHWWDSLDAAGWIDSRHRPIRNWQSSLNAYGRTWRANQPLFDGKNRNATHQRNPTGRNTSAQKPDEYDV